MKILSIIIIKIFSVSAEHHAGNHDGRPWQHETVWRPDQWSGSNTRTLPRTRAGLPARVRGEDEEDAGQGETPQHAHRMECQQTGPVRVVDAKWGRIFISCFSSLSSQCQWHGTCISSGNQFLHFLARSPLSCDTLPSVSYDHAAVNRVKQILITIFYLARDVLQPLVWINSIVKTCCGGIQCVLLYQVVNLINYFIHTIHRNLLHCIVW